VKIADSENFIGKCRKCQKSVEWKEFDTKMMPFEINSDLAHRCVIIPKKEQKIKKLKEGQKMLGSY